MNYSCTLANGNLSSRVVYDVNRKAFEIEPGKKKTLTLDPLTRGDIRDNFRSRADKLEIVAETELPAKVPDAVGVAPVRVPSEGAATVAARPPQAAGGRSKPAETVGRSEKPARGIDTAASLLAESRKGMAFFEFRNRAKTVLGKNWPGQKATRADIEAALEKL